jgi:hypothetical protein
VGVDVGVSVDVGVAQAKLKSALGLQSLQLADVTTEEGGLDIMPFVEAAPVGDECIGAPTASSPSNDTAASANGGALFSNPMRGLSTPNHLPELATPLQMLSDMGPSRHTSLASRRHGASAPLPSVQRSTFGTPMGDEGGGGALSLRPTQLTRRAERKALSGGGYTTGAALKGDDISRARQDAASLRSALGSLEEEGSTSRNPGGFRRRNSTHSNPLQQVTAAGVKSSGPRAVNASLLVRRCTRSGPRGGGTGAALPVLPAGVLAPGAAAVLNPLHGRRPSTMHGLQRASIRARRLPSGTAPGALLEELAEGGPADGGHKGSDSD